MTGRSLATLVLVGMLLIGLGLGLASPAWDDHPLVRPGTESQRTRRVT